MKSFVKKLVKIIKGFISRLSDDHVNAYAAQSAFFIIVSAFPLIMLIFSLIKYTPISEEFLINSAISVMPNAISPLATTIITEMYEKVNSTVLSVTAILTVWSASKSILAIIRGLNIIFNVNEKRGYFRLRLISSIYTILFVVGIVTSLTLIVFGNSLVKFCQIHIPLLYEVVEWIINKRILYVPIILTLLFIGLYKLVQNKRYSFISHIPGALFSALGWMVFSYGYSIYIDNFAGKSYAYGSLTTLVLLMLWIYICMYILFIGAEINVYFRNHMLLIKSVFKETKSIKSK